MLITPEYVEQNRLLHEQRADYGANGGRYALAIIKLARSIGATTLLDYGCGKGSLGTAVGPMLDVRQYDPAIAEHATPPEPADIVACLDVLEHIEFDCLAEVLNDLKRLATKAVFLTVATMPAKKTLPDGRNAHLIVEPCDWWLPKFNRRWTMMSIEGDGGGFLYVGAAR